MNRSAMCKKKSLAARPQRPGALLPEKKMSFLRARELSRAELVGKCQREDEPNLRSSISLPSFGKQMAPNCP